MALGEWVDRPGAVAAEIGASDYRLGRSPKVLCATGLWPRSDRAVWRARAVARGPGAQLLLLNVIDPNQSGHVIRQRGARARSILEAQARKLALRGNGVEIAVRAGQPHETIADVAIEWDADLIVLGPYRRRFGDSFRGTAAERVIRRARRPVLVVNRESAGPYEHVLLTSDLSRMAAGVAWLTGELGLLGDSRASVVHALQNAGDTMLYMVGVNESEVSQYRRSLSRLAADEIETQLTSAGLDPARFAVFSQQASPFRAIEQVANRTGSGLVAVGTSRFPLLKRVFAGSVSNDVLRRIRHDVLLVSPAAVQRARRRARREFIQRGVFRAR